MMPRFAKLPLRRPQVKANRRGLSLRYCLLLLVPTLSNSLNALSCSTYTPWWLVLRLSICLWYKLDQKSVHINLIMSSSSLNLFHSLVNRSMILYPTLNPIHSNRESSSSPSCQRWRTSLWLKLLYQKYCISHSKFIFYYSNEFYHIYIYKPMKQIYLILTTMLGDLLKT